MTNPKAMRPLAIKKICSTKIMGRMIIRIVMMSGLSALVNWWTRRQEAKAVDQAHSQGQDSDIARDQARRQGQTVKRSFRMIRRFMRF